MFAKKPDVDSLALIDELAEACESSLSMQNALRPLIPTIIWNQPLEAFDWQNEQWPIQELTATVMFTDIAGFTALMETYPVHQVIEHLNVYLGMVSQIVERCRGDVHKFLGDGLMAIFICPADAVKAGREIQRAVAEFNDRQEAEGWARFETRLAIDTGDLVLASVGSRTRQDYTLLGRPVNQASHLCDRAAAGTVWISQRTFDRVTNKCDFRRCTESVQEEHPVAYEMACI